MKKVCAILILVGAIAGWKFYTAAPITHPAGVLIASEPEQLDLSENAEPIQHGKFQLKPLARFSIEARLLHRKRYRWDRGAALSPIDLAVGWGRMSDQAVLDHLRISQSMRFFWYEYQMPSPIPRDEIVRHSTNIHVIPADAAVAKACASLRVGELVHLKGELVEATGPGIGTWRSSLRRDDDGNGACELFRVEEITRLDADNIRASARLVSR